MGTAADWIGENFSLRSFGVGMGVVLCVMAGLGGYAYLRGDNVWSARLQGMPSQTVAIVWNNTPVAPEIVAEDEVEDSAPIRPDNYVAVDIPAPETVPEPEPVTEEAPVEPASAAQVLSPGRPLPGLFEQTQWGRLPVIRKDDQATPFQSYRRPFDRAAAGNKPVISVAVFDLGLSDSATNAAMRTLPAEVSLILSPYMMQPDLWITEAQTRGHEIWLSLPVQGKDYPLSDPGPQTMLIGAAEKDNLQKLYWTMGRATNYVGFVTAPDATFMKAEQDMRPVLTRVYGRGLGFIDGSLLPPLIPQTMAKSMNAPYGTVDIWVDAPADRAAIADALAQAEKLARQQGYAAALLRPYPLSYQMVQEWIATLPDKGFVLAPLSAQTGR